MSLAVVSAPLFSSGTTFVTRLWVAFGVTRLWACLWVSQLGGRRRSPSSRRRRIAGAVVSAGSCRRRLRYVPAASSSPPRRPPPPATSSWSQSCRRSIVSPQSLSPALRCTPVHPPCRQRPHPCPRPLSRLPTGLLGRRRRGSRRCVAVSSPPRRRRPHQSSASARRRPSSSSRAPQSPLVVRASSPPPLLPSSVVVVVIVVVVVATVIAAFAVIVAAVIVVNTLGHGSRCRCGRSRGVVVSAVISVLGRCRSCSPLSVVGCHRLVVTVVRRPSPPLSSLILASTSSPLSSPVVVLSHPAAGIADLGLGCGCYTSSGRGCARRRRLAVFRWRGTPGAKNEGHPGTSDSSILQ